VNGLPLALFAALALWAVLAVIAYAIYLAVT
jgi:hypothetical protein